MPMDISGRHRGEGEGQKRVRQASTRLAGDTLLSNSLYLMLDTAAMAVLGFVVWLLAARLYHPSDVGVGTTLISASGLLGLASLLGLNNSLVRYLPTSARRDSHVNTALLLVLGASVTLACGYVLLLPWIAPELAFLHDSPLLFVGFALFHRRYGVEPGDRQRLHRLPRGEVQPPARRRPAEHLQDRPCRRTAGVGRVRHLRRLRRCGRAGGGRERLRPDAPLRAASAVRGGPGGGRASSAFRRCQLHRLAA